MGKDTINKQNKNNLVSLLQVPNQKIQDEKITNKSKKKHQKSKYITVRTKIEQNEKIPGQKNKKRDRNELNGNGTATDTGTKKSNSKTINQKGRKIRTTEWENKLIKQGKPKMKKKIQKCQEDNFSNPNFREELATALRTAWLLDEPSQNTNSTTKSMESTVSLLNGQNQRCIDAGTSITGAAGTGKKTNESPNQDLPQAPIVNGPKTTEAMKKLRQQADQRSKTIEAAKIQAVQTQRDAEEEERKAKILKRTTQSASQQQEQEKRQKINEQQQQEHQRAQVLGVEKKGNITKITMKLPVKKELAQLLQHTARRQQETLEKELLKTILQQQHQHTIRKRIDMATKRILEELEPSIMYNQFKQMSETATIIIEVTSYEVHIKITYEQKTKIYENTQDMQNTNDMLQIVETMVRGHVVNVMQHQYQKNGENISNYIQKETTRWTHEKNNNKHVESKYAEILKTMESETIQQHPVTKQARQQLEEQKRKTVTIETEYTDGEGYGYGETIEKGKEITVVIRKTGRYTEEIKVMEENTEKLKLLGEVEHQKKNEIQEFMNEVYKNNNYDHTSDIIQAENQNKNQMQELQKQMKMVKKTIHDIKKRQEEVKKEQEILRIANDNDKSQTKTMKIKVDTHNMEQRSVKGRIVRNTTKNINTATLNQENKNKLRYASIDKRTSQIPMLKILQTIDKLIAKEKKAKEKKKANKKRWKKRKKRKKVTNTM